MIRIRFVARHLIAKADDRVAEGVTDNYDSRGGKPSPLLATLSPGL